MSDLAFRLLCWGWALSKERAYSFGAPVFQGATVLAKPFAVFFAEVFDEAVQLRRNATQPPPFVPDHEHTLQVCCECLEPSDCCSCD